MNNKTKKLKYGNFEFTIQMYNLSEKLAKETYEFIRKTIANKSKGKIAFSVLWKINRKVIK